MRRVSLSVVLSGASILLLHRNLLGEETRDYQEIIKLLPPDVTFEG